MFSLKLEEMAAALDSQIFPYFAQIYVMEDLHLYYKVISTDSENHLNLHLTKQLTPSLTQQKREKCPAQQLYSSTVKKEDHFMPPTNST